MSDVKNTLFVSSAILVASFFSYLLQYFLGRNLSVGDYGIFNTLLSVAAIVGVPATVFGTSLIKEVASLTGRGERAKVSSLFWQSVVWSAAVGVVVFGFFNIFKGDLVSVLKISNQDVVTSFAFYFALTFILIVPLSYLQGLLKYKVYGVTSVLANMFRFGVPFVVLLYSIRVSDVFLGMAAATILTMLVSYLFLRKDLYGGGNVSVFKELLIILKFSLPVMLVSLCLMAFSNNDLILVRANFTAEESGYYAGVVTLGKILLFGSISVATVMFPRISALKSAGKDLKQTFFTYLKMQLAVVGLGTAIFVLFPHLIATSFFGTKFLASVQYLPLFSVFVALYVVLNFLVLFLFAVDIITLHNFLIVLVMAQVLLIARYHSSLFQVIYINIFVIFAALVVALAYAFNYLRRA